MALLAQLCMLSWHVPVLAAQGDRPTGSREPAPDCRTMGAGTAERQAVPMTAAERARWRGITRTRYVVGDVKEALDEWNQLSGPRVQCVNVDGVVRTRRNAVIEYLGTESGEVLTAETVSRLERRLAEMPIASASHLRFDPEPDGSTTVTPILKERGLWPGGTFGWGAVGLRAAFQQELRLSVASYLGHGEVFTPSYRFSPNRPRAMLRFEAPAPGALPGVLAAQVFGESQSYQSAALGPDVFRQTRYRVGATLSDWVTSGLRWEGGVAYDRIGPTSYLAVEGSLSARALADRVAFIVSAGRWAAGSGAPFSTSEVVATARSTATPDVPVATTLIGVARATNAAPLAVWPAASSAEGRGAFLRAHPLRTESIIVGEAFGRTLLFSTTEYEHPFHTRAGTLGIVGFVDVAQASRRLDAPSPSRFHVDVGTGVRFNALGAGKIRLEFAYGLRDGRARLSAGYVQPWGTR
jgi:hypothetical protein